MHIGTGCTVSEEMEQTLNYLTVTEEEERTFFIYHYKRHRKTLKQD